MNILNEDLDDSALQCMSLVKKRKAYSNSNTKHLKHAKMNFGLFSPKKNKDPDGGNNAKLLNELPKDESCSSQCNESKSGYFESTQIPLTCPLCMKGFNSESKYTSHTKQCAKKRKMTTQELLNALELQKKQMKERMALGLGSHISLPKKPKKINKNKNSQAECDLPLGLALSKSLETNEPKPLGSEAPRAPIPTLEEFGFMSSNSLPEPVKKKVEEPILKERTKEERQRILTEKAAVILLDEESHLDEINTKQNILIKSAQLTKLQNQVAYLWNLGENERKSDWYVKELKELLLTEEETLQTTTPALPENIQDEISKLKLPNGNFHENWRKMINNEMFSDLTGRSKDDQIYYLHTLILFARCPQVLDKDLELILNKFNLSTILIFFEFLYCGTLNGLIRPEVEELLRLGVDVNHEELVQVLNCLGGHLTQSSSEGMIPSSLTPDLKSAEVAIIDEKRESEVTIIPEDSDIFEENMVDLTQSSHGSSTVDDNASEEESNGDKSYWSFLQHEKEREELEEIRRRKEEEKENTEICTEMEKIETSMKQQHEMMQQILNEFEEDKADLKNKLELDKIYQMQRRISNDSETKDLEKDFMKRTDNDDCIFISSDSETRASKPEDVKSPRDIKPLDEIDYDIPYFDPYDDFNHFSPVGFQEDLKSQSFITGDVSFTPNDVREEEGERKLSPEYFSTPVTNRRLSRINSSVKKSLTKKRSNLSASRIIRKSLGLKMKSPKLGSRRKKSGNKVKKKESLKGGTQLAEALTTSILNELSNSPLFKSSTPLKNKKFIEMTPSATRDCEFGECVTPSPNYSNMGDSVIKEQLSKYGLKKNLGKSKAKKILRHIYEELHPIINTETGKLVKMLPTDTPKPRKKPKSKAIGGKRSKSSKSTTNNQREKEPIEPKTDRLNSSKSSDSIGSICSLDKSTDYDSDGSEFGGFNEPLTQSLPNNPVDLPSALNEFLARNPEFHQKILLYEPIWLEELQKNLKETFKKHFKLSDLMDYLDQQCITFRSAAQKRNNQRRNEKKNSPRKKKTSPS